MSPVTRRTCTTRKRPVACPSHRALQSGRDAAF